MPKFRKLPVEIEAQQFKGDRAAIEDWIVSYGGDTANWWFNGDKYISFHVATLEGYMEASYGDWIIKGIKNEFYPCKADIFNATYEAVDSEVSL